MPIQPPSTGTYLLVLLILQGKAGFPRRHTSKALITTEKPPPRSRLARGVYRAIRGVGHCDFTGGELVTAFIDLVTWVEFGARPDGDVVLDPAAVADPEYGCQFTDFVGLPGHILPTACP